MSDDAQALLLAGADQRIELIGGQGQQLFLVFRQVGLTDRERLQHIVIRRGRLVLIRPDQPAGHRKCARETQSEGTRQKTIFHD